MYVCMHLLGMCNIYNNEGIPEAEAHHYYVCMLYVCIFLNTVRSTMSAPGLDRWHSTLAP